MRLLKKLALLLMERVAAADPGTEWTGLSIVLMDDWGIERVNRKYLDHCCPTDVLSFRYESLHEKSARFRGEVIVNVERAISEGSVRGSASSELALYLAHGCDHLTGALDAGLAGRRRMRARELRWLKRIGKTLVISNLLPDKK